MGFAYLINTLDATFIYLTTLRVKPRRVVTDINQSKHSAEQNYRQPVPELTLLDFVISSIDLIQRIHDKAREHDCSHSIIDCRNKEYGSAYPKKKHRDQHGSTSLEYMWVELIT